MAGIPPADGSRASATSGDGVAVRAPLTGTVISIAVSAGDAVTPGSELLVLESMKMEHAVISGDAGRIHNVAVRVGDTVTAMTPLVVIEPHEHAGAGDQDPAEVDLDRIRPDLHAAIRRHHPGSTQHPPPPPHPRHH